MDTGVLVLGLPGDSADVDTVRNGLAAAGIEARGAYVGASGSAGTPAEQPFGALVAVYGPSAASPDGEMALAEAVSTARAGGKPVMVYRTAAVQPVAPLLASFVVHTPAAGPGGDPLYALVSAVRAALQQQAATVRSSGYQEGFAPPTALIGRGAEALNRYRSLSGLSQATVILFGLIAAAILLQILGQIGMRANPILGLLVGLAVLGRLLCDLAGVITYLVWFYRAHKNLEALNARDTRYSSAWTVAGYVVPFLNLVRPYQMMVEVWKGSDPNADVTNPSAWKDAPTSPLVGVWWTVEILGVIIALPTWMHTISASASPPAGARTTDWASILSSLLTAMLVLLTAALVSQVTTRQRLRYARLSGGAMPG